MTLPPDRLLISSTRKDLLLPQMSTSTMTREELEAAGLRRMGETPGLRQYLRDIWARREFMVTVPMNELRAQNQNTVLGNLWHLLNPLFLAGVFYLVFGVILGQRGAVENYVAFLVIGVLTFSFIQKSTMGGARAIVSNLKLMQTLSFPRAALPISVTVAETVSQVPALLALMAIVVATGEPVQVSWVLTIPIVALQAVFNLGLAFYTSRLTFHFRDTAQFLPYLTRIWLYLSGVFFTVERVPEGWAQDLFLLNPAYVFMRLNRYALLGAQTRNDIGIGSQNGRYWLLAGMWTVITLVTGFFFFKAQESEYGRE